MKSFMKCFQTFLRKSLRFLWKALTFLPALFMMWTIFGFSAQPSAVSSQVSGTVSVTIVELGERLLNTDWSSRQIQEYARQLEHFVRKAAHLTEYFLLAVSLTLPLWFHRLRGWRLALAVGTFCLLFAGLDELHQAFVPGRSPAVKDVCIDTAGSLGGVFLSMAGARIIGSRKSRP